MVAQLAEGKTRSLGWRIGPQHPFFFFARSVLASQRVIDYFHIAHDGPRLFEKRSASGSMVHPSEGD